MRTLQHHNAHWLLIVLATLLIVGLLATAAAAQEPAEEQAGGLFGFLQSETAKKYGLDPAAPNELVGVVIDEQEKAVAGASVYYRPNKWWGPKALRRTVTDARGQFSFDNVNKNRPINFVAVQGVMASRTETRKWTQVDYRVDGNREPVVLRLRSDPKLRSFKVRVIEAATKKPLPGAVVQVTYTDLPRRYETNENGEFEIGGLIRGSYEVDAVAATFARKQKAISLLGGDSGVLTIALEPGGVLTGVVRDPQGNPLPRPRVHLRDPADRGMFFDYTNGDADGVYLFDHVPAGMAVIVDFDREGFYGKEETIRPLRPGERRGLDVALAPLPPGVSVKGLVQDEQGHPISGAQVTVRYDDRKTVYTGADGQFRIDDIKKTRDTLIVKAPQRAGRVVGFVGGPPEKPGQVNIELKPGAKIRGRVVDEAGEPIAGARVEFPTHSFGTAGESIKADDQGRFEFDNVPEGSDFRFSAAGYSELSQTKLPLNEDRVIDVTLLPQGIIKGVAVDEGTGDPVSAFNVRMTFSPERKPGDPSCGINTDWDNPGRNYRSSKGHFDIPELVVGMPMMVTVEAEGYRPVTVRRIEAGRPEAEERGEFRLKKLGTGSTIEVAGVARDADGKPVADAVVWLMASVDGKDENRGPIRWFNIRRELTVNDRLLQVMRTATDEQGRFRFKDVYADCFVELAYWGEGVAPGRLRDIHKQSPEKQQALTIETVAPAELKLKLNPEAFAEARNICLVRDLPDDDPNSLTLDCYNPEADGSWVIRDIPPGEYKLRVLGRSYVDGSNGAFRSHSIHQQRVVLKAGEAKSLEIEEATIEAGKQSSGFQRAKKQFLEAAQAALKKAAATGKDAEEAKE